jgi:hypothetical protein
MAKKNTTLIDELQQVHKTFQKTVADLVRLARQKAADEVAVIENMARGLVGRAGKHVEAVTPATGGARGGKTKAGRPRKRIRRDVAQLKALAEQAVEVIKAAGKEGIAAGDLKRQIKGIDGSVKIFIEKFTRNKVKQEGKLRQTRYRIAA